MHTHDEVENILYRLENHLSVVNINVELTLDGVVHQDASSEAVLVVFIVPVSLVCDGNTVPAVGINVSKAFSTHTDNALSEDVRLLVEMQVVLLGVIESSEGDRHDHLVTHHGVDSVVHSDLPVEHLHRLKHFYI